MFVTCRAEMLTSEELARYLPATTIRAIPRIA
jgi:hypothetical protein